MRNLTKDGTQGNRTQRFICFGINVKTCSVFHFSLNYSQHNALCEGALLRAGQTALSSGFTTVARAYLTRLPSYNRLESMQQRQHAAVCSVKDRVALSPRGVGFCRKYFPYSGRVDFHVHLMAPLKQCPFTPLTGNTCFHNVPNDTGVKRLFKGE